MKALLAFLKRDWLIRKSYRLSLFVGLAHLLFSMAAFLFIGRLFDGSSIAALNPYGGNYFAFVACGLAFSRYVTASLSIVGGNLREEQIQGTLEAMLMTPAGLPVIVTGAMASELLWATVEVFLSLSAAVIFFGMPLAALHLPAVCLLTISTVVCFSGVGAFSAASALLFKEFNPASWVLDGLMKLTSGVFVPVAVMPGFLQVVAKWLPLTYALEAARHALLLGSATQEILRLCGTLAFFAVILWPLSLAALGQVIQRLKQTGELSFR